MRRLLLALSLTLAATALLPTQAASALAHAPADEKVTASLAIAETLWGGPAPCGAPPVTWVHGLRSPENGEPLGGYAYRGECRVELDASLQRASFLVVCRVVAHEYGHLHGREHVADPTDVMHHETLRAEVPLCAAEDALRLERYDRAVAARRAQLRQLRRLRARHARAARLARARHALRRATALVRLRRAQWLV